MFLSSPHATLPPTQIRNVLWPPVKESVWLLWGGFIWKCGVVVDVVCGQKAACVVVVVLFENLVGGVVGSVVLWGVWWSFNMIYSWFIWLPTSKHSHSLKMNLKKKKWNFKHIKNEIWKVLKTTPTINGLGVKCVDEVAWGGEGLMELGDFLTAHHHIARPHQLGVVTVQLRDHLAVGDVYVHLLGNMKL